MIILIPAYEPDDQLLQLIRAIAALAPQLPLVVVDDGSGPDHRPVFDGAAGLGCTVLGCTVLGYAGNRGKGHALKAGFGFIADHFPGQDVVCADSDGQNRVEDILRVVERLPATSDAMVLGTRSFGGNVPARSRLGNTATRWLFRLATGETVPDTQTGLRGYPAAMLPWLRGVPGERYEYELNLLLEAKQAGYLIRSVDIATVYLDHNSGSHFRPLSDSARIYAPLMSALDQIAVAALPAKLLVEAALLAVSYSVQQRFLFAREHRRDDGRPHGSGLRRMFHTLYG